MMRIFLYCFLIIQTAPILAVEDLEKSKEEQPIRADLLPSPQSPLKIKQNIDNQEYSPAQSTHEVHISQPAQNPPPAKLQEEAPHPSFCKSSRQKAIIEAVSKHLGMNCENITPEDLKRVSTLSLENKNLIHISMDDFAGLHNVTILSLFNNHINNLNHYVFTHLKKLNYLNLSHNLLKSLPNEIFKNQKDINHLDLSNNLLTIIPSKLLQGLKQLHYLNISNNYLEDIEKGAFDSITNLSTLRAAHNKINSLNHNMTARLNNLTLLDFSFNQIQHIARDDLQGLYRLVKLNLSHNHIHTIEQTAFIQLFNLVDLNLSHNQVPDINWKEIENLGHLNKFNYSHNPLNEVIINPLRDFYQIGTDQEIYDCLVMNCWNNYAYITINRQKYKFLNCRGRAEDSKCAEQANKWQTLLDEGHSLKLTLINNGQQIKSFADLQ